MSKIIVTGAARLGGTNLIPLLRAYEVVAIDKNENNLSILAELNPGVKTVRADVSQKGSWSREFKGAACVVTLHAQIAGLSDRPFVKNNVVGTENVIKAMKAAGVKRLVHVSSSVVLSKEQDDYTRTKRLAEKLVEKSGLDYTMLRPPLMYGCFDRKHLGYLGRLMKKTPIFPIPGKGEYIRQPLYAKDLARVIVRCIEKKPRKRVYSIIGKEKIPFKDLMRKIRDARSARCVIVSIPVPLFAFLMRAYALVTRKPPFTTDQLDALVAGDVFDVEPWWDEFGVPCTPFDEGMKEMLSSGCERYALATEGER